MNVTLDENGVFSALSEGEIEFLYFDGSHPGDAANPRNKGRWTLMTCADGEVAASSFTFIGEYADLDEALRAMSREDRFAVDLPYDGRFMRPGEVPALEVLSRLGYDAVRTLSVFAITDDPPDADPVDVHLGVARKLMGTNANAVPVKPEDRIGADRGEGWSVEIRLPIEGVVKGERLRELVEREIGGADLQIAEEMAVDDVEIPRPKADNLLSFASFKRR